MCPLSRRNFLGGTSLLIIVGVMLDTMRQVETHLFSGITTGSCARVGFEGVPLIALPTVSGEAAASGALMWLYVGIAVLVMLASPFSSTGDR